MLKQTPKSRVLFVRRFTPVILVLFGVFSLLFANLHSPKLALAATANTINFQARLQTSSGAIVPDGYYNVEFKLYSASSGGSALWTEDYTNQAGNGLQTVNGYLSANLGSVTAFPSTIDWSQPLWLTMNVGGTGNTVQGPSVTYPTGWDGEMNPRLPLTAVPYAFQSGYATSAGQLSTTSGGNTGTLNIQAPTGGNQTFVIQNQGAAGTFNLLAQNASTGVVSLGTASSLTGSIAFANSGSANTLTLATAAETVGNATITIPNTAGANDTVCLLTLANCGSGISTVGTFSATSLVNGASISGNTITFGPADSTNPGMVSTGTQTFAGNKTFSGTTTLNNTTLAAGTSITITGGTRPASPTVGMLYYDTTTNTLLTYNGTKWMSDKSAATKIVAMGTATGCTGTSPVASSNPDGADFVSTSCTSSQTTINAAIAALPSGGGTVYLEEGTYIVNGPINLTSNVTLVGASTGTVIKLADSSSANIKVITTTGASTHNLTVANLLLDGNSANNTNVNQYGIYMSSVGSSTTQGVTVNGVTVQNFKSDGVYLIGGANANIINTTSNSNGHDGFYDNATTATFTNDTANSNTSSGFFSAAATTFSNVIAQSNSSVGLYASSGNITVSNSQLLNNNYGMYISDSGAGDTVINNIITGNTVYGIYFYYNSSYNTVSDNYVANNGNSGIYLDGGASYNVVSGNNLYNNAGTSSSSSIHVGGSGVIGNSITNNVITDTAGTGHAIENFGTNTYIAGNTYSGTGATNIYEGGTNTIYANQLDSNGNLINQSSGGGFTVGASSATASLTLQGGMVASQLPAPTAVLVGTQGTTGSTTYRYQVTALDGTGESTGSTIMQTTSGNAILSATDYNTFTWKQVDGAVQYNIYRCTGTGCTPAKLATVAGNVTTYNDQAAGSPSGTAPATNTTGGGTFAGVLQGSSGAFTSGNLTLGTASTSTGSIKLYSASGSGSVTLSLNNPGSTNYTLSIPTLSGNDTICTLGTGCGASGVNTIGTYNTQTSSANGAVISGTTLYLQSANGSTPGLVDGNNQSFAGNKTFTGSVLATNFDTPTVTALSLGTSSATNIYIGNSQGATYLNGNAINIGGANIVVNGTTTAASKLNISGEIDSTSTTTQYGFSNQVNFNPQGASLGALYSLNNIATLTGSAVNVASFIGTSTSVATSSGYTGTVSDARGLNVGGPTIGGSNLFTKYTGINISSNSANGGNTSGTITNTQLNISGTTAGAGTGGTVNNYGINLTQPAGTGGTTNNYGLYIQGNGVGSTNYSIYNASTAASYFAGNIQSAANISANSFTQNGNTVCDSSNNCGYSAGISTVGALDGGTANANGATISGSTIYLQSASASFAGLVNTGAQTFVGNKLFQSTTNSTTAFQVQNASGSSLLTVDTTNGDVVVKTPNSTGTSAGVARLVVQSNWTDTAGDNSIIDFGENAGNQTNAGRLMYNGQTNLTSLGALGTSGTYNPVLNFDYNGNGTTLYNYTGSKGLTLQNNSTSAGIVIKPGSGADRSNAVQIQNAAGTSMFNVDTTGSGEVTISGTLDTTTATTLNIGTSTANALNIGSSGAINTINGTSNFQQAINLQGTYTTSANARMYAAGTLNSSSTTFQYGIQQAVSFNPTGGSLGTIYGIATNPNVTGSSYNLSNLVGIAAGVTTSSGYTGQVGTASDFQASDATINGSQQFTTYVQYGGNVIANNGGNTSGTLNNYGMLLSGATAAAASGGTVNNYGIKITQPSGSGAGTTNNYGLYIQGNGAGSTNYSIYNASTALSYFGGSINSVGGYQYNGTAGATTTCSGGNVISNATVQGGIITTFTCAPNGGGIAPTLQNVYDNSSTTPTINLSSTGKGLFIQDASTSVGGNLFAVQNSTGSTQYLAVTTSGINVAGTATVSTGVLTPSLDTAGTTLNVGTTNATTINLGTANATTNINGNISMQGTITSGLNTLFKLQNTLNSSYTGSMYGIDSEPNFNPTGASVGSIYGMVSIPTISGSALNVSSLYGIVTGVATGSGYTGQISSAYGLDIKAPTVSGSQLLPSYYGIGISANSANGGNTSGTITNTQLRVFGTTAGAGTGGTVNNYGINLTQPSGTGGTTNNYGLFIQGNGAGSTNYAIYSNSTAASLLSGSFQATTINATSGYQYNGTAGANITTCTTGQFLQNPVVQGGIVTGGTCASAAAGLTGSGTVGTIAMFSGSTTNIASSILSQSGTTISVAGSLSATGTISTNATAGNALAVTGAPTNSATSSLIQIGNAIVGGNSVTNGGTYLGLNAPSSGAGSAADLMNLQVNGSSKFKVDKSGNITVAGTASISGAATLSSGFVGPNASYLDGTGSFSGAGINSTNGYSLNGTAGASTTCSGGDVISNATVQGGIITGFACAANGGGVASTLQSDYTNSTGGTTPEIVLDSTRKSLDIQGYSGQTADLLDLRSYAASGLGTLQFGVDPSGNVTAAGSINATDIYIHNGLLGTNSSEGIVTTGGPLWLGSNIDTIGTGAINVGLTSGGNATGINLNQSTTVASGDNFTVVSGTVNINGAPTASATNSLIRIGNAIQGGNANGTYLGLNAASGYSGDFLNFQVNGTSKFELTSGGNLTIAGTGVAGALQAASLDTSSAGALTLGGTNATSIIFGSATNGITFTASGGLVASGTAQHVKTITLAPEYAGAVLDSGGTNNYCGTGNNNGTMTSAYDSTNRTNYYDWTSTSTSAQCYSVVVQVPIPSDFNGWASAPDIEMTTDNTSNTGAKISVYDSSNTAQSLVQGSVPSSWGNMNGGGVTLSGTYTAGNYFTFVIQLDASNSSNTKLGNIKLTYNSKF